MKEGGKRDKGLLVKVAVGLSGGVDSATAAFFLKQQGYQLTGVFMKIWSGPEEEKRQGSGGCYGPDTEDLNSARKVARWLDIPLKVVDLSDSYQEKVIGYFVREYLKGKTPNPCIVCNRFIKFGLLWQALREKKLNFDYFATGHYARVEYGKESHRYLLKKGVDTTKDQSYFLYLLHQKQLRRIIFPLGTYWKHQVREIARREKIPVSQRKESQDFSPDWKLLFRNNLQPGPIFSTDGHLLGRHQGIACYTIGQRQGLRLSSGKPLYVIRIDARKNALFVGPREECWKKQIEVSQVHYVSIKPPVYPLRVTVKIRSTQPAASATLYPISRKRVRLVFDQQQWAVTPGQSAVFYQEEILLGGGIIQD